ncbi:GAF domain-containing protein [bacterium]|nr:GAF domain-containing protein [bacterium]
MTPEELYKLARAVTGSLSLRDISESAVKLLSSSFQTSCADLYAFDPAGDRLILKARKGFCPGSPDEEIVRRGEGLAGRAAAGGEIFFIEDIERTDASKRPDAGSENVCSFTGVPLFCGDERVGVLGLYAAPRRLPESDRRFLVDAGRIIGQALYGARAVEEAALRSKRYVAVSRAIAVTRRLGSLDQGLLDIAKVLVQTLDFDFSWIGLTDEESAAIRGVTGFGPGMKSDETGIVIPMAGNESNPAVEAVQKHKAVVPPSAGGMGQGVLKHFCRSLGVKSACFMPVLSSDRPLGVIGVFHTGTERFDDEDIKVLGSISEQAAIVIENARLYDQVRTSEERYRKLFESTGSSLAIVDSQCRLRLVNHAFENLSGFPREKLVNRMKLTTFFKNGKGDGSGMLSRLRQAPQNWEAVFISKKGITRQVHVIMTRIPGSTDTLVSLIDMTRERDLERRLYKSEELAAIGELSAGIAHEIRNPLVAIITSVGLLKEEAQISAEGRQLLDVVKEESDHLASIVEDFLQFARPKKPVFEAEDVSQVARDAVKRCRDRDGRGIEWREKYRENLSPVLIDRHQIQQVVTNLLLNAIDALGEGGTLGVETGFAEKRKKDQVVIRISDTGTGIPRKNLEKVFQPFFSTKEKGTGMGLAICRRIIEEHAGEIRVESETGKGTVFSVILPARGKQANGTQK